MAFLERLSPGEYLVIADHKILKSIDKKNEGVTIKSKGMDWPFWDIEGTVVDEGKTRDVKAIHKFEGNTPSKEASKTEPWTIGGMTVTKATKTVPHEIRGWNLKLTVDESMGVKDG
jgi:hypothetical protein